MATGWILREMKPADLKNHPVNSEIYGTPPIDDDMLSSVKDLGILEPIRATKDSMVLSGHRRRQHAIAAKLKTIPVLVARHAISDAEQVIEVVESNRAREKTMEQKAREYSKLSEAKAELARKRMLAGKKSDPTSKVTEGKGEAKKQAAEQVGLSRNTAEKAAEVVREIDAKTAAGDTKGAAELRHKLNGESVAAAHRVVHPLPFPPSDTEAPPRDAGQDEPEPEHVPDPKRPTDKSGNALPDRPELLKAFATFDLFHSTEAARNVIQNNCLAIAQALPDGKEFREAIDKALKGMFHLIEGYRPAYVCKSCNGGKCKSCRQRGYTSWQSR